VNRSRWPIAVAAIVLGGLVTAVALHRRGAATLAADADVPTAELGQRLIRNTAHELGSGQADPARRFSGNNLACASCHMESGRSPGTLSLMESAAKYPAFSARDGKESDLADRINGCMQRSMNGRPLREDSLAMRSMIAYIEQLGLQHEAMSDSRRKAGEPAAFVEPDRRARPVMARMARDSRPLRKRVPAICFRPCGARTATTSVPAWRVC
jgi:cytochrome c